MVKDVKTGECFRADHLIEGMKNRWIDFDVFSSSLSSSSTGESAQSKRYNSRKEKRNRTIITTGRIRSLQIEKNNKHFHSSIG